MNGRAPKDHTALAPQRQAPHALRHGRFTELSAAAARHRCVFAGVDAEVRYDCRWLSSLQNLQCCIGIPASMQGWDLSKKPQKKPEEVTSSSARNSPRLQTFAEWQCKMQVTAPTQQPEQRTMSGNICSLPTSLVEMILAELPGGTQARCGSKFDESDER